MEGFSAISRNEPAKRGSYPRNMYAAFFGLKQAPFSIAPDPHYLFMSERHREALAHLLYGLDGGGGFVLLTGEIGAGKTTVCRCFLEQVPAHCQVAYIFNPKLTVGELLRTVCDEFHISVPASASTVKDFVDPLNAFLLDSHGAGRNSILIIDEAQNLSAEVLEQLRLLTNLETHERKLLQIILIGQPELRTMLAKPELEQLAQRVIARFHLEALSEADTRQYIGHRLAVAGLQGPLPFSTQAIRLIHRISRGVPRRINLLADRSLLGAYATGTRQVSAVVVRRAAQEVFDTAVPPRTAFRRIVALVAAVVILSAAGAAASWWWNLPTPSLFHSQVNPAHLNTGGAQGTSKSASGRGIPASAAQTAAASGAAAATETLHTLMEATHAAGPLAGWQALASRWNVPMPADVGDPCSVVADHGLQCLNVARGSLAEIRQLDRPVVLTLTSVTGKPRTAPATVLLTSLSTDSAQLQVGSQSFRLPLSLLASVWRGDFATFWRAPPGFEQRAQDAKPLQHWALRQLTRMQHDLPADASEELRLKAFQAHEGLEPDGRLGPLTLMHLNQAAGVPEPRLESSSR